MRVSRRNWAVLLAALAFTLVPAFGPPAARGELIRFDEFPADNTNGGLPANRYAALGITFVTADDGSTWGGLDQGDPGNWGLRGTNGSVFSGFNGGSYSLRTLFSQPVENFALDVSRSNGSSPGTPSRWRAS